MVQNRFACWARERRPIQLELVEAPEVDLVFDCPFVTTRASRNLHFEPVITDHLLDALPPVARDHALYLEDARLRRDAFGIIVWAAVLLEAVLEDVLRADDTKPAEERPDLGGLINRLQTSLNREVGGGAAAEVLDAAHTLRVNRNRAVHNTGLTKQGLANAARKTSDDLRLILNWWLQCRRVSSRETPAWRGRVFLATITPDQARHRGFLLDLKAALAQRLLEPVTVELTQYDRRAPLARVAEAMRQCDAVLVVGLERSRAFYVRDREGSEKEADETNRRYSSAWLHMEGALAYGLGLGERVYVLCEPHIHGEGVFDKDWNQFQRVEINQLSVEDANVRETLDRILAATVSLGR
jgi:hypothetical protein